ncbi:MAG: class GN sortase [Burkholderiaceae bacterium]
MNMRQAMAALAVVFGLAGLGPTFEGAVILAKARLAQILIDRAWQANLADKRVKHRPWSWADLSPVARLRFDRQRTELIVLDNDAPRTLAFGPGLRAGTPPPAQGGNSVISAHRDTHFAVLGDLHAGDRVDVQVANGDTARYRVVGRRIVDVDDGWIADDQGRDQLSLVTCWPLDALRAGGRERLVVTAVRERQDS